MKLYIISQDIIGAINRNMETLIHYKTKEYLESLFYSPEGIFKYSRGKFVELDVENDNQYSMHFENLSQSFICDESITKHTNQIVSRIPIHHVNEQTLVKEFSTHGDSNVKLCIAYSHDNIYKIKKAYFHVRDKIMNYEEDLQQFLSLLNLYN